MFEYFPGNYVWNLSVNIALQSGGQIGEIDEMCRPILAAARQGDDPGTDAFHASWRDMADKLAGMAQEDEAAGRFLSAGAKLNRAAIYYLTAERMQAHGFPERKAIYDKGLDAFSRGAKFSGEACERVEIPYGEAHIAGLYVPAKGAAGPAPCIVHINGLDSLKEMLYRAGTPQALAERGIASLVIDQPGTGEALRLHGMAAVHDSERWASRVVDYLERRPDIDAKRVGLFGVSLGGYYAPRAVAFEPRFAMGACWGANHNWGEMQKRRLAREGDRPVPHYWEHVRWVWGAEDMAQFMAIAETVHLDGILDRIRVPFLVTHGENDRQIPLAYAEKTYEALINSPKRDLKVFTAHEGGVEHCSLDNLCNARDIIADWIAETLGGRVG